MRTLLSASFILVAIITFYRYSLVYLFIFLFEYKRNERPVFSVLGNIITTKYQITTIHNILFFQQNIILFNISLCKYVIFHMQVQIHTNDRYDNEMNMGNIKCAH